MEKKKKKSYKIYIYNAFDNRNGNMGNDIGINYIMNSRNCWRGGEKINNNPYLYRGYFNIIVTIQHDIPAMHLQSPKFT